MARLAKEKTEVSDTVKTHEGAPAKRIDAEQQLRRSVMACLLWEDSFYESGVSIVQQIKELIPKVDPDIVAALAIEAREKMKLRHIPLLVVREMARLDTHKHLVAKTLERIIQRPDELAEFVAIYFKDGKCPLSGQVKKGLAEAFKKFDTYQLGKYNRDDAIKLKDVMFLSHPKPGSEHERLWRQLIGTYCVCGHNHYNQKAKKVTKKCREKECDCAEFTLDKVPIPETWEVILSDKNDGLSKKEKWEKVIDIWVTE